MEFIRVLFRSHVGPLSHGATLKSAITDGSPVLEIESQAVVRDLLIEGVQIQGNGSEGHGLLLHADSPSVYLYDICLRDVFIELCGGDGCVILGNIFESQINNCFFRQNDNGLSMGNARSEEHTSELQSLMRISYAVFCLKKKRKTNQKSNKTHGPLQT